MAGAGATLTIAGLDPTAGAGLLADTLAIEALGGTAVCAPTGVVVQRTGGVQRIEPVSPDALHEQLELIREDFPLAAIKTGALCSAANLEVLARWRRGHPEIRALPWVIDPVLSAGDGTPLLEGAGADAWAELVRDAALITPNRGELAGLCSMDPAEVGDWTAMARDCLERCGARALLVTDGPQNDRNGQNIDTLITREGIETIEPGGLGSAAGSELTGINIHGTGCVYSAAIAAGLAEGLALIAAVIRAKRYVERAIAAGAGWPVQPRSGRRMRHGMG